MEWGRWCVVCAFGAPRRELLRDHGPNIGDMRDVIDKVIGRIAKFVLRGFFRSLEIQGAERVPRDRPVLLVANHFNGFVDPATLVAVFGRTPRFLAKATLWKNPLVRPLLRLIGILPVARSQDTSDTSKNESTFAACHDALREGEIVALFPEGTTTDTPMLQKIRTGAARIALGARADGVEGLEIVPIGLKYESKVALRRRAFARIGDPIDLDSMIDEVVDAGEVQDETNHEAVNKLTELIRERLEDVSPDYADWVQDQFFAWVAEVSLRSQITNYRKEVSLIDRELLAQQLAYADDERIHDMAEAAGRYLVALHLTGLDDTQVIADYSTPRLVEHATWTATRVVGLTPAIAAGIAVNWLPYWALKTAGQSVSAPVTKGTVRLLTALGAFPLTWALTTTLAWRRRGWKLGIVTLLAGPFGGFAAVYAHERWTNLTRAWNGWQRRRDLKARLPAVLAARKELTDAIDSALMTSDAGRARGKDRAVVQLGVRSPSSAAASSGSAKS